MDTNLVTEYINKINLAYDKNVEEIEKIIDLICRTFFTSEEVEQLKLDFYSQTYYVDDFKNAYDGIQYMTNKDYGNDLDKIKLHLQLKYNDSREGTFGNNLETTKGITFNPTQNQTINLTVNVKTEISMTINNIIDIINDIPINVISDVEKKELTDNLKEFRSTTNKDKKWEMISRILKYILDKGVEVGISLIPHIGELIKLINV